MKNIVITGSTDGIGKLTALEFAKQGHKVYVHGRNPKKLDTVISEIKEATGNENIEGFVADFSDISSVRKMAKEINEKVSKIDVLINNAGILQSRVTSGTDGIDIRFLVNYFAPYILTNAVLPLLKKADKPRVINLSSAAQAPVSTTSLLSDAPMEANNAYAQSKLALTMFNTYLSQTESGIISIAVNPGSLLNTKMAKEAYGQHWSPASKGVNILFDLALSEEYLLDSGKYFDNDKGNPKGYFSNAHPDAYAPAKIEKLIELTDVFLASK